MESYKFSKKNVDMIARARDRQREEWKEHIKELRRSRSAGRQLFCEEQLDYLRRQVESLAGGISEATVDTARTLHAELVDAVAWTEQRFRRDNIDARIAELREQLERCARRIEAATPMPTKERKPVALEDEFGNDPALEWGGWVGVSRNGKLVTVNEIQARLEDRGLGEEVWDLMKDTDKIAALRSFGWDFGFDEEEADDDMDRATMDALYEKSFSSDNAGRNYSAQRARELGRTDARTAPVAKVKQKSVKPSAFGELLKDAAASAPKTPARPRECLEWGRWLLEGREIDLGATRARLEMAGYDADVWDILDDSARREILLKNLR